MSEVKEDTPDMDDPPPEKPYGPLLSSEKPNSPLLSPSLVPAPIHAPPPPPNPGSARLEPPEDPTPFLGVARTTEGTPLPPRTFEQLFGWLEAHNAVMIPLQACVEALMT